jgi:transposase
MSKRKWTNIELFEPEIIRLREAGMTRQQIADELFLEKVQIKNWINRYNKRQSILSGRIPKPKGRPRKDGQAPKQNIETELRRLRMENKLLRDFLQSTERK